jgi:hypothetical protein
MKKTPDSIRIDDTEYVPATSVPPAPSDIKIAILQRGWVMVGRFSKDGEQCRLDNAHVIRVWGTTNGLGELALNGPTSSTKLDPSGVVTFHELTLVALMDCRDAKWSL